MTTSLTPPIEFTPPGTSSSRRVVDALIKAGIVSAADAKAAIDIVRENTKSSFTLNFNKDSEYLTESIKHHTEAYFGLVMTPLVMAHHQSATQTGRMLKDEEVDKYAVEVTSLVMGELGIGYIEHMSNYFGDTVAMTRYVYSRVHRGILDSAISYNASFLDSLSKKNSADMRKRRVTTMANANIGQ